jgi:hypothetical protein
MLSSFASAIAVTRVRRAGAARRHAPRRPGRYCAPIPCAANPPPLLVPRQNRPQLIAEAREGLVQRHAAPARIREDRLHPVINQRLHQNIGATVITSVARFVSAVAIFDSPSAVLQLDISICLLAITLSGPLEHLPSTFKNKAIMAKAQL